MIRRGPPIAWEHGFGGRHGFVLTKKAELDNYFVREPKAPIRT